MLFLALLSFLVCSAVIAQKKETKTERVKQPDVLVLVLSGIGPEDNVAINYSTEVAPEKAQQDIIRLQELSGWAISGAQASVEAPNVEGAKPTTGTTFTASGIVDTQQGILPIEPFIAALKRFDVIEIDYIVGSGFTYRGLKDFENDYVKIKMSQSGKTYRFTAEVKDSDFEKLDLPVTQVEQEQERNEGMSSGAKIWLLVGFALLAAATVFLITYFVGRNRQQV